MISSWPVEPSGNRTVSTSRSMTRPEWIRLLLSCINRSCLALEQPGERHLEPFGEEISRVAPHVGVNRRAGGGRGVRSESQASRDDLQSQHVKTVADQQHAATVAPIEPAPDLIDGRERVVAAGERNHRFVRNPY